MPGEATVSIYLITGILKALTKINGESSIAITWGEARILNDLVGETSECDIEALLPE